MNRFLFFSILLTALLGCETDPKTDAPTPQPQPTEREPAKTVETQPAVGYPSFADVVEKTRPAVVNIFTKSKVQTNRYFLGPGRRLIPEERLATSLGSGFIIDNDGYVLTNYHVIKGASQIEVRLLDDRKFNAEVVGEDPKTDVALLKILNGKDLPTLPLGDSEKLRVGEWTIAIGNPLGLTSTVTAGIASATGRRDIPISGDLRYQDFIQTDASINPGNSGGALVNVKGEVIGINTAVNSAAQGIGFAIPINMVKELLPRLKEGGRLQRAWLGVYPDDVPDALRPQIGLPKDGGALVKGVVRGGPAAKAKLRKGDVILTLGDERIDDPEELAWVTGNHKAGDVVPILVHRGDQKMKIDVKLGVLPE